jgi:hypothetical protein
MIRLLRLGGGDIKSRMSRLLPSRIGMRLGVGIVAQLLFVILNLSYFYE